MDIVIVAQYLGDLEHLETTNGRFVYLAKMLAEKNNVEIITTTFLHGVKQQAKNVPTNYGGCKITALYETGYPKNICLKRFASHKRLANNIRKYLLSRKKPDVIYAAVPSLAVASEVAKYCHHNKVRFMIDIQDLWPEAFKMVFHVPVISDLIFGPMTSQANQIYSLADEIVSVSQTYAKRALRVNKKCKKALVAYLGTDRQIFDQYAQKTKTLSNDEDIKIVYVGSLSSSYDLDSVIEAICFIKNEKKLHFVVIGDGALKKVFEKHTKSMGINCTFTGRLPYSKMVEQLCNCDIAVNPIRKGSAASIINKVGDYAMAGLPVVNTQESQEYRELLDKYQAGINCVCEDKNDIAKALLKLVNDKELRKRMGSNSRRLGEERFDRKISYQQIVNSINKI